MNGLENKNKSERIHFNRPFTTMIIYCPVHWFSKCRCWRHKRDTLVWRPTRNIMQKHNVWVRLFLGDFAKLRKATASFVISVWVQPSVRLGQLGSHSMDFHETCIWRFFQKSVEKIPIVLKSDTHTWYFYVNTHLHLRYYLAEFFLEWETFQIKVVKKIDNTFYVQYTFFRNSCSLWDIVANVVQPDRPQMAI